MNEARLRRILERLWEKFPTLCGEQWPALERRLAELLEAYDRSTDEEERARLGLAMQEAIEEGCVEAARLLYQALSEEPEEQLRGYMPLPGYPLVPPQVFICPEEGCGYKVSAVDPAGAGKCPHHGTDLVPAEGPTGAGRARG